MEKYFLEFTPRLYTYNGFTFTLGTTRYACDESLMGKLAITRVFLPRFALQHPNYIQVETEFEIKDASFEPIEIPTLKVEGK